MVLRLRWRRSTAFTIGLVLLATSCSWRSGVIMAGAVPPPDGAQMAQDIFDEITAARAGTSLPAVPRDPILDEAAARGLEIIEAGLPEGVSAIDHLIGRAALPVGLEYGVGFEEDTPGIDEKTREAGGRGAGQSTISNLLLGADPAFDGIGWAAAGPWSVAVLRARKLGPADGAALQAALEGGVQRRRPHLDLDAKLAGLAARAVSDGRLDLDDEALYGQAGGVPVEVRHTESDPHLPTSSLSWAINDDGPGSLSEPWLNRLGIAAHINEEGNVLFVALASGEADRAALGAALAAAAAKAPELVNRARREAALPEVRVDPTLVESAKQWAGESSRRGCYVTFEGPRGCPGPDPKGADRWAVRQHTWSGPEAAFTFYLAPAEPGDELLKRFGAVALLGPEGTVWSAVVFAV